jgi:hypothetical protein
MPTDEVFENYVRRAAANLKSSVNAGKILPENVFCGSWGVYLFCDDGLVFEKSFVHKVQSLLDLERGTCAYMRTLEESLPEEVQLNDAFVFSRQTTEGEYAERLWVPGGADWLSDMYAYGCTSDVGSWVIYTEKQAEFAVIAIRKGHVFDQLRAATKVQFSALPIIDALQNPPSFGLSSYIVPSYRDALIAAYS